MRTQLTWTLITELVVMAAGILLLKFAAQFLGTAGFGEYTLTRRAVALLFLPLVMGLGVAAPRYIAISRAGALPGYSEAWLAVVTLSAGLLPSLIIIGLMNLSPDISSSILFGTASMTRLVPSATVALGGLAIHTLVYAIFRGRGEMRIANLLQLFNNGVVPVTAFFLAPHDAAAVLMATGATWVVTSGVALIIMLTRENLHEARDRNVREHLSLLLRYGLPRVPGDFALVGLFALPALIALRAHGVVAAGQFSAGMSLLALVSGVFAPVGLVVMPRASAQAAMGDLAGLRRLMLRMLVGGMPLAVAGVIVGELLIPSFVRWYFGKAFEPAIPIFRACLLGAIPYVVYVLLRNILDAMDVRALNSRNLIVTLVLLVTLCLLRTDIMSMALSLLASLTLLSILSLRDTLARLGRRALAAPATVPG